MRSAGRGRPLRTSCDSVEPLHADRHLRARSGARDWACGRLSLRGAGSCSASRSLTAQFVGRGACVHLGNLSERNTVTTMSRGSGSSSGPLVQSRSAVVGVYIVGTIAGSVIALASPSELVGVECTPAAHQPEVDFCTETRQFTQPPLLVAAAVFLLVVGMLAGGLSLPRIDVPVTMPPNCRKRFLPPRKSSRVWWPATSTCA